MNGLPKFKSHKVVEAFRISRIVNEEFGKWALSDEHEKYSVHVGSEFMERHRPEIGGYYVKYPDGYQSFSPARAFHEGYTKVNEEVVA